jgi:hypothetical protein
MRVETNHEEECKVMGVPEHFKALMADLVMRSRVHQKHDEEHKMSCDTACLRVVNFQSSFLAYFCSTKVFSYVEIGRVENLAYEYVQH